ncbi:hypothetical protein CTI12_AA618590 [Artemisia annua]|uniref:Helitron helicase-like domain-containing protein n=1 Tax=Artemisia annua TaxID=35608 RepID=A0A2U1KCI2_ARTAN|nr:hypothetical protein CTI12_AA618590 [Artemisia annua]
MRTKGKPKIRPTISKTVCSNDCYTSNQLDACVCPDTHAYAVTAAAVPDEQQHVCVVSRSNTNFGEGSSGVERGFTERLSLESSGDGSTDGERVTMAPLTTQVSQGCEQPIVPLVTAYHGPVTLDFVTGTASPQVGDMLVERANVTNNNGKRVADIGLQDVSHQSVQPKRRHRQFVSDVVMQASTVNGQRSEKMKLMKMLESRDAVGRCNHVCLLLSASPSPGVCAAQSSNPSVVLPDALSSGCANGARVNVTESTTGVPADETTQQADAAHRQSNNHPSSAQPSQCFAGTSQAPSQQHSAHALRSGPPTEYRGFGPCDCVYSQCHAKFWYEERLAASTRRTGKLCPDVDVGPRFLQLYIYDTDNEVKNRLENFTNNGQNSLRPDIVEGLIELLDHNNALVQLFRTARDKLQDADLPEFRVRLFNVIGSVQHELPTADAIGAIVFDSGPETEADFDIIIEAHSGEPQRINRLYPCYMALHFPLLFIYGEQGYHADLRLVDVQTAEQDTDKRITMADAHAQSSTPLSEQQQQTVQQQSEDRARAKGKQIMVEP